MDVYLVTYDIRDPKRLRAVHRKMKGFGDPVQYSVFRCTLSKKNLQYMLLHLELIIDKAIDSVMVVSLGPADGTWKDRVTFLGEPVKIEQEQQVFIF